MATAEPGGMKDTIDALELLTEQHDEVEALFSKISEAKPAKKAELFKELADKLAAHATMEEKLFYPSVLSKKTQHTLLESTEEHLAIKRVLADLLEMDVDDERFDAKLTVLCEEVRHHARDEEEEKLFPMVRRAFSKDELAALGNEMFAMFESLLEREPRMNVPAETAEAARLEMHA
jgi:hemerythrin superfamily protein